MSQGNGGPAPRGTNSGIARAGGLLPLGLLLLLTPTVDAYAQASPEVVQRLQGLLQEATRARAALERDKVRLEKEVSSLEREVDRLKKASGSLEKQLQRSQQESTENDQAAQASQRRYGELSTRFEKVVSDCRESLYAMRDIEVERNRFLAGLADRNSELAACVDANARLRDLNEEILVRYEEDGRGGVFQSAKKREPFTRLSRVRLQNALDEYRFQASDLEVLAPENLLEADASGQITLEERWQCTDLRPPPERPPIP